MTGEEFEMATGAQQTPSINYVVGVSWPRSGHHLLVRMLKRAIGEGFVYCPHYSKRVNGSVVKGCCDLAICGNRGNVHFCKNHDSSLLVPKIPGTRYLVQYRDFLPAMVSSFELHVRSGKEDSEAAFRKTSRKQAKRYREFIKKWVLSHDPDIKKLVIRYEHLTTSPEKYMLEALEFFGLKDWITPMQLKVLIARTNKHSNERGQAVVTEGFGVKNTRKVEDFRYYDPKWFEELAHLSYVEGLQPGSSFAA